MALTNFANLTTEQLTVWSRDLWAAARNKMFLGNFAGTGQNAMIQRIKELKKGPGGAARAVITLVTDMEGDGVVGDNQLEGNEEAMKAYDLLDSLTRPGERVMPPVVYRALDFWVSHGFVHRIASLNAYVVCGHPLHNHGCQLLICSHCGQALEVCNPRLREAILETARASGFHFEKVALEIHGRCPRCQGAAAAPP